MLADQPALEGTLDDVTLTSLLRLLAQQGRSGELRVDGPTPAVVRLHEGRLLYATGSDMSPLRRVISEDTSLQTWMDVRQDAATPTEVIAAVAESDQLPRTTRRSALRELTVMTLFEFSMPSADRFSFFEATAVSDAATDSASPSDISFEVEEVLSRVTSRISDWREIVKSVPAVSAVFEMADQLPGPDDNVVISADDWSLLAAIDGKRSVRDIVEVLSSDAFTVCRAMHRLTSAGLLSQT